MPPRPVESRPGSLVLLGASLLVIGVIAAVFLSRRDSRPRRGKEPGVAADSVRARDPLPIRRLADRPGGSLVLEAIEASGGWDAWQAHRAVSYRLLGVFFHENGAIQETRSERVTLRPGSPVRVRIESEDGASLIGFGEAGAWGARRQSDGRWNPAMGPGALPPRTLRDLALDSAWLFSLPFNLGDPDASFPGEPVRSEGDSLVRLDVSYPPAPGDTAGRVARLGFDPDSGHILEVLFLDRGRPEDLPGGTDRSGDREDPEREETADGAFLLTLHGYTDFEGVWRPTRRALFEADPAGRPLARVYEQRLLEVTWDPPVTADLFEPPPPP